VLATTNGGTTWKVQNTGTSSPLRSVWFAEGSSGKIGWAIGGGGFYPDDYGVIVTTTDGGGSWTTQPSNAGNELHAVFFSDVKTGWIVGGYGTVLKTTNGGVTSVESSETERIEPRSHLLGQNYPNPFNPSTTISYDVPRTGMITIRIFDLLGRLVKTLLNDEKSPGTYSIAWNGLDDRGSHLSSGMYFYELKISPMNHEVSNFDLNIHSELKKMILIK
jgi:hypothetical protein